MELDRMRETERKRIAKSEKIMNADSVSKVDLAKIIGTNIAIEEYQATNPERLLYAETDRQDIEEKLKRQGGANALRHLSRVLGIKDDVETVARHYRSDIDARKPEQTDRR